MSLRLTVRLGTGQEKVVDCSFDTDEPFSVALELAYDMRNDRDGSVAHCGRTPDREHDAEKTVDLPHRAGPVEGQCGSPGVDIYRNRVGILGHGQISQNGFNRS